MAEMNFSEEQMREFCKEAVPVVELLDGIKKYCEDAERPYDIMHEGVNSVGCSTGEYGLDCCMVDAVVADMIIQYAVMGEIVYG